MRVVRAVRKGIPRPESFLYGVGLLDGKVALITGVANRWSIATGIAREMHGHGATIVLTYQGARVQGEVEKLAAELGGVAFPCDVANDASLATLAESVREKYGKLDTLVHSIAFVNKEDLQGKVYTTSRAGFALARRLAHPFGQAQMLWVEAVIALDAGDMSGFHNTTSVVLAFPR